MSTIRQYTPDWNGGARTIDELARDGYFTFQVGQSTGIAVGLSKTVCGGVYELLEHAFLIQGNLLTIIERGVVVVPTHPQAIAGSTFKIARTDGEVHYYLNDVLLHTSATPSTGTVWLDTAFYAMGDEVIDVAMTAVPSVETGLTGSGSVRFYGLGSDSEVASSAATFRLVTEGILYDAALGVGEFTFVGGGQEVDLAIGQGDLSYTGSGMVRSSIPISYANTGLRYGLISEARTDVAGQGQGTFTLSAFASDTLIDYAHTGIRLHSAGEVANLPPILLWATVPITLTFLDLRQPIHRIWQTDYQQRNEVVRSFGYSLLTEIDNHYYTHYELLDYNPIQTQFALSYNDSLELIVTNNYADQPLVHTLIVMNYADQSVIHALHELAYDDYSSIHAVSDIGYRDFTSLYSLSTIDYADQPRINALFVNHYSDYVKLSSFVEVNYDDYNELKSLLTSEYRDYADYQSLFTYRYQDRPSIHAVFDAHYESVDLAILHAFTYSLLEETQAIRTYGYRSEPERLNALFNSGYALNDEETVLLTGSCWVELNGEVITIREVSINSDEGSPYYQCSIQLVNELDYRKFTTDTDFIVHLFADEYHFVVDQRSMNRSIDGDGHLQVEMTIEGLSPIVRYDAPRSITLTKVWDEPILLSTFITELIGTVTWNGADDWIPSYRLAAENAIPLELARTTLESIGSLLQSNPDGSIMVRPLWPVSVPNLSTTTPDQILNDDVVFTMSEGAENNDWRNRFRILDQDVTDQDQLEFVADDDDALNGWLYGYPSPWRDALSFRHTRGEPIYLMPHTVEVVEATINDDGESEPELIEFSEGKASVRYPIVTILEFAWLADSLGAITFTPYTNELTAAVNDYSLAQIRYTTKRMKARTGSAIYTTAQYLLEEST